MLGIATVAIGETAVRENQLCLDSVKKYLPDVETLSIRYSDLYLDTDSYTDMQLSRIAKTNLVKYLPSHWTHCIYLDSDTRVLSSDFRKIFDILRSGYDLCICPSEHSDFWHIEETEKEQTFTSLEYVPLQLQAGMFGFTVNKETLMFFQCLSDEYMLHCNQDQAAFVRAYHQQPLKMWLMGYPFNSAYGGIVKHLFGRTRSG